MSKNKACLIFSSDPNLGARNIQFKGSKFTVFSNASPFFIGSDTSRDCTVEVIQASVWNSQPNISPEYDNNRFVVYDNKSQSRRIDLTVPTGQYDVTALITQLDLQWTNYVGIDTTTNAQFSPTDTFQNTFAISGSDSTQLISIQFVSANPDLAIDWNLSTLRKILGFTTASLGRPTTLNGALVGDTTAMFNTINSYHLHSDLVSQGIAVNGVYGSTIGIIPITALPGNLVVFQGSVNNMFSYADNLLGRRNGRSSFTFWLTNEKNDPIDMVNEYYTFTLLFRWTD